MIIYKYIIINEIIYGEIYELKNDYLGDLNNIDYHYYLTLLKQYNYKYIFNLKLKCIKTNIKLTHNFKQFVDIPVIYKINITHNNMIYYFCPYRFLFKVYYNYTDQKYDELMIKYIKIYQYIFNDIQPLCFKMINNDLLLYQK